MTTQPAGEHHTGTLNLTGQGNPEQSPISDEMVQIAVAAWASAGAVASVQIRAALEAAYPAIRQHVAEQIAAELDRCEAEARRTQDLRATEANEAAAKTWGAISLGYFRAAKIAREIGGGQ